jgi:hypothetical protein
MNWTSLAADQRFAGQSSAMADPTALLDKPAVVPARDSQGYRKLTGVPRNDLGMTGQSLDRKDA